MTFQKKTIHWAENTSPGLCFFSVIPNHLWHHDEESNSVVWLSATCQAFTQILHKGTSPSKSFKASPRSSQCTPLSQSFFSAVLFGNSFFWGFWQANSLNERFGLSNSQFHHEQNYTFFTPWSCSVLDWRTVNNTEIASGIVSCGQWVTLIVWFWLAAQYMLDLSL